jgi:hypothetical protein
VTAGSSKALTKSLVRLGDIPGEVEFLANTLQTRILGRAAKTRISATTISLTRASLAFYVLSKSLAFGSAIAEEIGVAMGETEAKAYSRTTRGTDSTIEQLQTLAISANSVRTANV